ncbi:TIR domain-containing protein [uncultured Hoeflea sp.]|uniref:TIR domain-containing protein n=1 Tax=uncultured Hoeflea sp. TaxID=538666 RepID=UPI0026300D2D|nr:TIR domain-containing protein [uncultured Hoeflea sp.]
MQTKNPDAISKTKVFISYARSNSKIARKIEAALNSRGFEVLIDTTSLEHGEEWKEQLSDLIAQSALSIWLISPKSISSSYCLWEMSVVSSYCKKTVPVVISKTDLAKLPNHLGGRHVFPADRIFKFPDDMDALEQILRRDVQWLREGADYLARSEAWQKADQKPSYLLSGAALRKAEAWFADRPKDAPMPPGVVLEFLRKSRAATVRWRSLAAVAAALLVFIAGFAFNRLQISDERAQAQANLANLNATYAAANELRAMPTTEDRLAAFTRALRLLPGSGNDDNKPFAPELLAAMMETWPELHLDEPLSLRHDSPVAALEMNDTETIVASGSITGEILLQELDGQKRAHRIKASVNPVLSLLFSGDNTKLAASVADGIVHIYDTASGSELHRLDVANHPVHRLIALSDEQFAAASRDGLATILDFEGRTVLTLKHLEDTFDLNPETAWARKADANGTPISEFASVFRPPWLQYVGLGVTDVHVDAKGDGYLTFGEDGRMVHWDSDGNQLSAHNVTEGPIYDAEVSAFNALFLATSSMVDVWKNDELSFMGSVDTPPTAPIFGNGKPPPIIRLYSVFDGRNIAGFMQGWTDEIGRLYYWDAQSGASIAMSAHTGYRQTNSVIPADGGIVALTAAGEIRPEVNKHILQPRPQPIQDFILRTEIGGQQLTWKSIFGHEAPVSMLSTGEIGNRFVSADMAGLVLTWNNWSPYRSNDVLVGETPWEAITQTVLTENAHFGIAKTDAGRVRLFDFAKSNPSPKYLDPIGILAREVLEGPAEKAGVLSGDLILKYDGRDARIMTDFVNYIQSRPTLPMDLTIERDGQILELEVIIGSYETTHYDQVVTLGRVGIELFDPHRPETFAHLSEQTIGVGMHDGRLRLLDLDVPELDTETGGIVLAQMGHPIEKIVANRDGSFLVAIDTEMNAILVDVVGQGSKDVDLELFDHRGSDMWFIDGTDRFVVLDSVGPTKSVSLYEHGQLKWNHSLPPHTASTSAYRLSIDPIGRFAYFPMNRVSSETTNADWPPSAIARFDLDSPEGEMTLHLVNGHELGFVVPMADPERLVLITDQKTALVFDISETRVITEFELGNGLFDEGTVALDDQFLVLQGRDWISIFDLKASTSLFQTREAEMNRMLHSQGIINRTVSNTSDATKSFFTANAYHRMIVYKFPIGVEKLRDLACSNIPAHVIEQTQADSDLGCFYNR